MNTKRQRIERSGCPRCSSSAFQEHTFEDTVDFRGAALDVAGLKESVCDRCGHKWQTDAQRASNGELIRQAYGVYRDQARARFGLLSAQEIRNIRDGLGLNQREAAKLFGGGPNSFNKYESGEVLQSFAMDRLLRVCAVVGEAAMSVLRNPSYAATQVAAPVPMSIGTETLHVANSQYIRTFLSGSGYPLYDPTGQLFDPGFATNVFDSYLEVALLEAARTQSTAEAEGAGSATQNIAQPAIEVRHPAPPRRISVATQFLGDTTIQ